MSFEWLSLISAEIVAHSFSLEFPISGCCGLYCNFSRDIQAVEIIFNRPAARQDCAAGILLLFLKGRPPRQCELPLAKPRNSEKLRQIQEKYALSHKPTVSSKAPKSTITSRRSHVRSQDGNCSTPQVMCHNGSQINDSVSKGTLFTVSQMPLLHDVLPARVPKNLSNPAFLLSSPAEKQHQCTSTTFAPTLLKRLFAKAFIRCVAHYHNFSKFSNTVTSLEGLCFASRTLRFSKV